MTEAEKNHHKVNNCLRFVWVCEKIYHILLKQPELKLKCPNESCKTCSVSGSKWQS